MKYILIKSLFFLLLEIELIKTIKLSKNIRPLVDDVKEDATSTRLPKTVNIKIEDAESDPGNMMRYENARQETYKKLTNAELKFEKEKRNLMNIISAQNSKLAELSLIADSNNYIMIDILDKLNQQ